MRCELVAERLPAAVDEPGALDAEQAEHVEQCLRCQAELVQYRRLRRTMGAMATERPPRAGRPAPTSWSASTTPSPDGRASAASGKRAAYLGGLAAATAAGVGGVLVLTTRRRPA